MEFDTLSRDSRGSVCTVSQKAPPPYILKNSVKTESISIIFGGKYPEEISHQQIMNLSTSPE